MNSSIVDLLMWALTPDRKHEAGIIATVPVPDLASEESNLQELALKSWRCVAMIRAQDETDPLFSGPHRQLDQYLAGVFADAVRFQDEIDSSVAKLFNLTAEGVNELLRLAAAPHVYGKWDTSDRGDCKDAVIECDEDENSEDALEPPLISGSGSHLSFCIGCAFGRWDVRRTSDAGCSVRSNDPFAPFPPIQPASLQTENVLSDSLTPENYPLRIVWEGVLVDDPEHLNDIVRRGREVLEIIWKDRAEIIEKEACESFGVKEIRDYFRKAGKGGFWDDHISRYSRSRRKAPIYWLLQSSKKNYAIWLYYHRLDKDLLFKAIVNYVEPKIRLETSRLESLRSQKAAAGDSGKEAKRLAKEVEKQEDFLSELRDFEDKLRRAANLHLEPDLNDGVVLNIAPLHELVPWKEAKNYWDELMEGKYEWSSIGKQLRQKGLVKP
jgi:hypothetical protein